MIAKPGSRRRSVALLIETSNHYGRQLLLGVRNFMRREGDWAVHLSEQGRGDRPPRWLRRWEGDGIIARIENRSIEAAVRAKGVPVINLSASGHGADLHTFISDSVEVARRAAEHLLDRGFGSYGYLGDERFAWSRSHGEHFHRWVTAAGHPCSIYPAHSSDAGDWDREQRRIGRWLQSLTKPVGIMVNYDIRGQQLLDVCRHLGIRVPDEVAVIGQHNDELLCELCEPPLTSVIPNPQLTGYRAAEMLHQLMLGRRVKARVHRTPPLGVATRPSTDIVAINDPQIVGALKFIREHACEGITVSDVLRHQPMSRTLLERKFRRHLRRTPLEEINRQRLDRAKSLLADTSIPIATIAERCGFSSAEYLSATFKKHSGHCPRDFRARLTGERR